MAAEQRFCNAVKIAKMLCSVRGDPAKFHPQRKWSRITGAQKGYKARRSDASSSSQYHHGSSSHTLSRARASVDFALLSER